MFRIKYVFIFVHLSQSALVQHAFEALKQVIEIASKSKKPTDQKALLDVIRPLQLLLTQVVEVREKNRASEFFNHLSVVSEGIPALGWVVVEPTPVPYIGEMKDAAQFYCNRVIKDYKEKYSKITTFHLF